MPKVIPLFLDQPEKQKEPQERFSRRKDGLYQLELRYALPDGTKKKKSFYGKTQSEAIEKRKAFERELANGINMNLVDVSVMAYADQWLKIHKANVGKNTYKTYGHDVDLLAAKYGDKRIRDITLSDVQGLVNDRAGLSKSAIKKTAMTLRAIFETARADRIITFNPCDKLSMPAAEDGTHRAITEAERGLITDSGTDHSFQLAAMLMLYAGLRRGEVMALNIKRDVDIERGIIHVRESIHHEGNKAVLGPPKSDAGKRDVPIMPPLLPVLTAHREEGLALAGKNGTHMTSSAFGSVLSSYRYCMEIEMNGVRKRWADEKQLKNWKTFDVRCHDLRHTYCTMLYDAGVDVKTAQRWMGHADIAVTMRIYTHLSNEKQDASVKAAKEHFEQYVGKNVGKSGEEDSK